MEPTEGRPFVTSGEIVKMVHVHPNTIAMWRATGKIIPRDRVGSSFLYDRREVLEFLKNRKPKNKK